MVLTVFFYLRLDMSRSTWTVVGEMEINLIKIRYSRNFLGGEYFR